MFDLILITIGVMAAVGGYRLGFVARAASWLGLVIGVLVGANLLPGLLRRFGDADQPTIALVSIGTLVGAALIGQALGLLLGSRLNIAIPPGPVRRVDQVVGGLLGVVGLLVAVWLLLPTLADIPGWTAEQARGSVIAREVNERFPDAPDTIQALRRLVGDDPFPQVFDALRPAPDPGPAPAASGLSEEVVARVVPSTVKIQGEACGRVQEGSGFFVDTDLVVTNAHVVAGENDSDVELSDGTVIDSQVVAFDPQRDLAILRTSGAGRPGLPLRPADVGDSGGVFGRPGGGSLEISPFQVGDRITAEGSDIYDRGRTRRSVLVLASQLQPGDSGSALVDPQGRVVGVAFAVAPDNANVAYALSIDELNAVLAGDLSTSRDTGPCIV
jgi:S1-C subfamily serine protease